MIYKGLFSRMSQKILDTDIMKNRLLNQHLIINISDDIKSTIIIIILKISKIIVY